jgi:hypothetical protein
MLASYSANRPQVHLSAHRMCCEYWQPVRQAGTLPNISNEPDLFGVLAPNLSPGHENIYNMYNMSNVLKSEHTIVFHTSGVL